MAEQPVSSVADQPQATEPRKVGIYDRPASADRPSLLLIGIIVLIIIALIAATLFYLM